MEAGYTGRRARVEGAWSGGGVSLNDLRVAASLISSSSSRTGSISLMVLFQLAKTSSDVRPSAGLLLSALKSSVRRPSASETSSRTNMWDAGKMPMKTCWSSSARADGLGFEVDGSEDSDQLTWGRREVQTTYLHRVSNYGSTYAGYAGYGLSYRALATCAKGATVTVRTKPCNIVLGSDVTATNALIWRAEQIEPFIRMEVLTRGTKHPRPPCPSGCISQTRIRCLRLRETQRPYARGARRQKHRSMWRYGCG